jgi:hypothetical protein
MRFALFLLLIPYPMMPRNAARDTARIYRVYTFCSHGAILKHALYATPAARTSLTLAASSFKLNGLGRNSIPTSLSRR